MDGIDDKATTAGVDVPWRATFRAEEPKLVALVQAHFREAWPDQERYPDLDTCQNVAMRLYDINHHLHQPMPQNMKAKLDASKKYARLFLRHLPAIHGFIKGQASALEEFAKGVDRLRKSGVPLPDYNPFASDRDRVAAQLAALDAAQTAVEAALNTWCQPLDPKSEPKAICRLADVVSDGWRRTGCKVSLSVKVTRDSATDLLVVSPLVQFVAECLRAIGRHSSPSTIGEILRGRDDRPRRGGRKAFQKAPV